MSSHHFEFVQISFEFSIDSSIRDRNNLHTFSIPKKSVEKRNEICGLVKVPTYLRVGEFFAGVLYFIVKFATRKKYNKMLPGQLSNLKLDLYTVSGYNKL